jgi:class 3 adenylate cyclase
MGSREYETSLLANETLDASVAFIDICSFTSISEKESPDIVVKLLNDYFDIIVKEIINQGGYIDKFIGDAIMAVFRGEFHLDRSLDASLAVRKKIAELPDSETSNKFKPQVAIGINSGEMISGNIGSATLKRLDYTVIGDTVNTAQRLQSVAGPGQIIINEQCFQNIKESFHCVKLSEVNLKNKELPVTIYNVKD